MVIERNKYYIFHCCAYAIGCAAIPIVCIFKFGTSIWFALLCNFPVLLVMIPGMITSGRTFIFDQDGITVIFWKYRKKYTWDQLKTKRLETHDLPSMLDGRGSAPYLKEVIFSPHKIRKPRFIHANTYCMFHPLSCIFVNFSIEDETYDESSRYYEVKEEVFMEKMNEWGVVLEEIGK